MDLAWFASQPNGSKFGILADRPQYEAIPQKYHIYLILLYIGTATFSFLSNLITLVVLKKNTNISKNLTKYLINLSYSDMMMSAFSIPFTYTSFMYGQWYFEPLLCPFIMTIQFYSVFVSVFTLVAISLDRYTAIINPLRSRTGKNAVNLIIIGIWILGFASSIIPFIITEATKVQIGNSTIFICRDTLNENESKYFAVVVFLITFIVPVLILTFVYSSIASVIFQRDLNNSARSMLKEQKRKIFKILANVVLTFVICWAPLQLMNLITTLFPETRRFNTKSQFDVYGYICFAFHWLAMAHSTANPVIYSFMSQSFRKQFINLFSTKNILQNRSSIRYSISYRQTFTSNVE